MEVINRLKRIFSSAAEIPARSMNAYGCTNSELRRIYHFDCFQKTASLNGAIVECGVAQGLTIAFLLFLSRTEQIKRKIWAIDSFQGFSTPLSEDGLFLKNNQEKNIRFKKYTVDHVISRIRENSITDPEINSVNFLRGWIPEVFEAYDGQPISLLNVDVDLYEPTYSALCYFWPMIQPGGIVMLDEYDSESDLTKWPGAKKAIDLFINTNDLKLQRHPTGRVFLVK